MIKKLINTYLKWLINWFLILVLIPLSYGQIGVGTLQPDSSAILELKSDSLGFLLPRMTASQRDDINKPAEGLMIFCTDCSDSLVYVFSNGSWASLNPQITQNIEITDSLFYQGLFYAADYSQNYTDRSLVDKAYVDSLRSRVSNGIFVNGSNELSLGGDLLDRVDINGNNESVNFGVSNSKIGAFNVRTNSSSFHMAGTDLENSYISLQDGYFGPSGLSSAKKIELGITLNRTGGIRNLNAGLKIHETEGLLVVDSLLYKGLVYAEDYSSNYTNRSLVDKEYVDNYVNNSGYLTELGLKMDANYNVHGNNSNMWHVTGSNNLGLGHVALTALTTGSNNVALGNHAMLGAKDASFNVAIGFNAIAHSPSSNYNVAVGASTLEFLTSGAQNVAIGYQAAHNASTGSNNVALGSFALESSTTGSNNVALGSSALESSTTGSRNIALGSGALSTLNELSASDNIAIGTGALFASTRGDKNIAIGTDALVTATTADNNVAIGFEAMVIGNHDQNVAIGAFAARDNSQGGDNVAVGYEALYSGGGGGSNVAVGHEALTTATSGSSSNTAIGSNSMKGLTTGKYNVGVGKNSLQNNLDGWYNVAIGETAMGGLTSGSGNISIGWRALHSLTSGGNNVAIGHKAGQNVTSCDNCLIIENSHDATHLINGDFANGRVGINLTLADLGTAASDGNIPTFQVGGTASKSAPGSWAGNSDRRLKTNIQYMNSEEVLNKMVQLKGATYEWNDTITNMPRPEGIQYGFIAQDIEKVWPDKITKDGRGYLLTAYGDYDPMMVESIKALNDKIKKLEDENEQLQQNLSQQTEATTTLNAQYDELSREINELKSLLSNDTQAQR